MRKTARIAVGNYGRTELGDFSRWVVVRAIEHPEGSPERKLWTALYQQLVRPLDKAEGGGEVTVTYRDQELAEMIEALEEILGQMDPERSETFELVTNLRQLLTEIGSSGR